MNCLEFRRAAGADPQHLDDAALAHAAGCRACTAHLAQLRAMDATILSALRVEAPAAVGSQSARPATVAVLPDRRRWYALAASVAGGVIVGSLLWTSGTRSALAKDAVTHMRHEAASMVATSEPADAAAVSAALDRGGVSLESDVGLVSYVMSCEFRGHTVPHLVVQSSRGPVTVLVLRDEKVSRTTKFHEQGYAGTLVQSGPGALAIIGTSDAQVAEVAAKVESSIEWK